MLNSNNPLFVTHSVDSWTGYKIIKLFNDV